MLVQHQPQPPLHRAPPGSGALRRATAAGGGAASAVGENGRRQGRVARGAGRKGLVEFLSASAGPITASGNLPVACLPRPRHSTPIACGKQTCLKLFALPPCYRFPALVCKERYMIWAYSPALTPPATPSPWDTARCPQGLSAEVMPHGGRAVCPAYPSLQGFLS
jgi:hypothetical protein